MLKPKKLSDDNRNHGQSQGCSQISKESAFECWERKLVSKFSGRHLHKALVESSVRIDQYANLDDLVST